MGKELSDNPSGWKVEYLVRLPSMEDSDSSRPLTSIPSYRTLEESTYQYEHKHRWFAHYL
jgi:hypothetical protein